MNRNEGFFIGINQYKNVIRENSCNSRLFSLLQVKIQTARVFFKQNELKNLLKPIFDLRKHLFFME